MCAILTCVDGTTIESCGELRDAGYDVPHEELSYETTNSVVDLAADDMCMCNIDLESILEQQPARTWEQDPFGYTETTPQQPAREDGANRP